MPLLVLVIVGLVLALGTSLTTLGWVLFFVGVGLLAVWFLINALIVRHVVRVNKHVRQTFKDLDF